MSLISSIRMSVAAALLAATALTATLPTPAQAQASAPAAAATPAAAKPAVAEEAVENPYGLKAMWEQGDWVAKGTLIILIIMSMGSWYIGIMKIMEQSKLMKQSRQADEHFWGSNNVEEAVKALDEQSAFRFVAQKGVYAAQHHASSTASGVVMKVEASDWVGMTINRSLETVNNRLQSGLSLLATVGSTAPFVGLFGTVWGIYNALVKIGISGQASIDKVAGPVGEALIMTAIGLAVAVPAVLGYNWLVRRNKAVMERLRHFGGGVHMILMGGGRRARRGD
jgi:biopolymer transport protein ExbB